MMALSNLFVLAVELACAVYEFEARVWILSMIFLIGAGLVFDHDRRERQKRRGSSRP